MQLCKEIATKYDIEKITNKIIPGSIKELCENSKKIEMILDHENTVFTILSFDEISESYKAQLDLFDCDIIPFASLDDDYLCLYYNNNSISVIYWSTGRSLESKKAAIFELYKSCDSFMRNITRI